MNNAMRQLRRMTNNMEQQENYSKSDLLDLSVLQSNKFPDQIHSNNNMWGDHLIDVNDGHLGAKSLKDLNSGAVLMSNEEWKINGELERDLEEEIKDGICRLALRLHRLYQHQMERNARESSAHGTKNRSEMKNETFSEVNITIRMEGGSKIEVNEIKKEAREKGRLRTAKSEDKQGESSAGAKNKKHDIPHQARLIGNDPNVYQNLKLDKDRRNCTSASEKYKRNVCVENNILLELGWRS